MSEYLDCERCLSFALLPKVGPRWAMIYRAGFPWRTASALAARAAYGKGKWLQDPKFQAEYDTIALYHGEGWKEAVLRWREECLQAHPEHNTALYRSLFDATFMAAVEKPSLTREFLLATRSAAKATQRQARVQGFGTGLRTWHAA